MAKMTQVPRNPDDHDNGDQPPFAELLKASAQIDANIDEEEQRRLKQEAMIDHGLVEANPEKPTSTKKTESALSAANQKIAELEKQIAEQKAAQAAKDEGTPAPLATDAAPVIPPVPATVEPNPFASGEVPK